MNHIYTEVSKFRRIMTSASGVIIGVVGIFAAFFASLLITDVDGNFSAVDKLRSISFWIVWAVVFFIVITVWTTNYRATKREAKNDIEFQNSILHYGNKKSAIIDKSEYLPQFAQFKNEEMKMFIERIIVESADLVYAKYKDGTYDFKKLEKWQIKKLRNLRKIKIKRLTGYDLLQEHQFSKKFTYSFLPQDEKTAERIGVVKTGFVKAINTFAFMFVGGLVFAMSGWVAGLINSFGVLASWIGAMVSANQYVENILRQRVVGKADLLTEFGEWVKTHKPIEVIPEPPKISHITEIKELVKKEALQ